MLKKVNSQAFSIYIVLVDFVVLSEGFLKIELPYVFKCRIDRALKRIEKFTKIKIQ